METIQYNRNVFTARQLTGSRISCIVDDLEWQRFSVIIYKKKYPRNTPKHDKQKILPSSNMEILSPLIGISDVIAQLKRQGH